MIEDRSVSKLEVFSFLKVLLNEPKKSINSYIGFTLAIIDLEIVIRELLDLFDLSRAQVLPISMNW